MRWRDALSARFVQNRGSNGDGTKDTAWRQEVHVKVNTVDCDQIPASVCSSYARDSNGYVG